MDLSSRLFKLAGAKKTTAQDSVSSCLLKPVEVLGNGICDGRLARASLPGQPENGRAVRRVCPCDYILSDLLARFFGARSADRCRPGPQVSVVDRLPSANTVQLQ